MKDEKDSGKREEKQNEKSNAAKGNEEVISRGPDWGAPHGRVSQHTSRHRELCRDVIYIDPGVLDHLIPPRDNLHAYQNFANPLRYQ